MLGLVLDWLCCAGAGPGLGCVVLGLVIDWAVLCGCWYWPGTDLVGVVTGAVLFWYWYWSV